MATKILKSVKGRRIRVTRLDECGDPVEDSCSTVVSDGFIRVTIGSERQAGDEIIVQNAWGDLCINEKDPDLLKRAPVSIELCEVDPSLVEIIGGDSVEQIEDSGGDLIGFAATGQGNMASFSIEVWTRVPGEACASGSPQWGYFVIPFVRNGRPDGDIVIENGALTVTLAGDGFPEQGWGAGPYATNPLGATMPSGAIYAVVVTDEQPPAVTNGCVAYVEPT